MGKSSYTVYSCYGRTRHMKSMPCKECNFRISVCTVLHLFYTLQFAVFIYRFAPVLHTSVRCIYIPFCACFSHFSSLYLYTALHLFFTLQVAVFIYRFAPVFHTSGRCIYSTAGQATDDNIKRRMRIACWTTKATNTHSQYVIIIAFPLQQRLYERASLLRYTYIACLGLTVPNIGAH